jgi:outer membrane lipoprotein-sorting protein
MTALLASLLLAVSQETAEDAFNKVEAAIESARTVRVTFTIDAASDEALPGSGSLSIEEDGRVKLQATLRTRNADGLTFSEECDGKKIVSIIKTMRAEGVYDPKNGRSNYNVYLSRVGIFLGTFAMHGFYSKSSRRPEMYSLDLKQVFQVKNLKFGESRKGMTGLVYDLKSAIEPMPIDQFKLWYDPNNFKIARREYRVKNQGVEVTVIEDYLDVQMGSGKPAAAPEQPAAAPVSDAEMENLFFKAKMTAAETHLQAGRKDKAAEILEEIITSYPKHPKIPDARRLLEQAKRK